MSESVSPYRTLKLIMKRKAKVQQQQGPFLTEMTIPEKPIRL